MKPPGLQMLQRAGAVPRPLVLGVEGVAVGIERDAAGTAQAAAHRLPAAVGKMAEGPAAKRAVGRVAAGETVHGPDRAVRSKPEPKVYSCSPPQAQASLTVSKRSARPSPSVSSTRVTSPCCVA